jgi:hypothetical protein
MIGSAGNLRQTQEPGDCCSPHLTDEPEPNGRAIFAGTIDQLVDDTKAVEALGAAEAFFDVQYSPNVNTTGDVVERMEHIWLALH